jgi:integrase
LKRKSVIGGLPMAVKTNCVINGIPYYRIRKKDGMKLNKDGKLVPNVVPFYGKSKSDAESKVEEYFANKKAGILSGNSYLYEVAEYYTYNVLINESLAEGTIAGLESAYRVHVVKSSLVGLTMIEADSRSIQEYYYALAESGLSRDTIRRIGKFLKHFFAYAEKEGYCRNPMYNVSVPRSLNEDIDIDDEDAEDEIDNIIVFEDNEIETIVQGALSHRLRFLFLLAIGSGMRMSEILGVKYGDFKNGGVMVNKQLLRVLKIGKDKSRSYSNKLRKTKNKTSRFINLSSGLLTELELHKKRHEEEMKANGYKSDFVFTTKAGNIMEKQNLRRAYKRFLKKIGVPEKKFHAFRATYCTLLCRRGVRLEVASRLMGHADITVTAKFYLFVSDQQKIDASEKINYLFLPENDTVKKGLNIPPLLKKHRFIAIE